MQRGTRAPNRLTHPPSWPAVVGCGTDEPRTRPPSRCQPTWLGSNRLPPLQRAGAAGLQRAGRRSQMMDGLIEVSRDRRGVVRPRQEEASDAV